MYIDFRLEDRSAELLEARHHEAALVREQRRKNEEWEHLKAMLEESKLCGEDADIIADMKLVVVDQLL